jgi:hypothetical protein
MVDCAIPIANLEVMKAIFPRELAYLQRFNVDFLERYPDYIRLLSERGLTGWHIMNLHNRMLETEKNTKQVNQN